MMGVLWRVCKFILFLLSDLGRKTEKRKKKKEEEENKMDV